MRRADSRANTRRRLAGRSRGREKQDVANGPGKAGGFGEGFSLSSSPFVKSAAGGEERNLAQILSMVTGIDGTGNWGALFDRLRASGIILHGFSIYPMNRHEFSGVVVEKISAIFGHFPPFLAVILAWSGSRFPPSRERRGWWWKFFRGLFRTFSGISRHFWPLSQPGPVRGSCLRGNDGVGGGKNFRHFRPFPATLRRYPSLARFEVPAFAGTTGLVVEKISAIFGHFPPLCAVNLAWPGSRFPPSRERRSGQ